MEQLHVFPRLNYPWTCFTELLISAPVKCVMLGSAAFLNTVELHSILLHMKSSFFVNPGRVEETLGRHLMEFAIIYICSSPIPSGLIRVWSAVCEISSSFPFLLPDFKAFEEAAEHFQPYIKFFATFDKGVSIHRPSW